MVQPDKKTAVRNLQRYLRRISYVDSDIPNVPVDGIFDDATKTAVIAFQQKNNLTPTGTADKETWDLIYKQYSEIVENFSAPAPLNIFPRLPDGYFLSRGDNNFTVSVVQFVLRELTSIYDSYTPPTITGSFDANTENAVKDFQGKNRMMQTGKVDKATWNRLMLSYDSYGNDYIQ